MIGCYLAKALSLINDQLPSSFRQPHSVHFTSSCPYHLITVTTFAFTIWHSFNLLLET